MNRKIVVCSGGFDPVHTGHIAMLNEAKTLGDKLIVALNSDHWLTRKKGKYFMSIDERHCILSHLNMVDLVITFNDDDNTAIDALSKIKRMYKRGEKIIFANGGDRTKENIPEMSVAGVEFVFGVGGEDKKNSSSELVNRYENNQASNDSEYYYGA
jgi:D-beta-D-heptose 7-phosphate kinase/D-beta-D-heptose 1-phosphate adenosyltransferase